MNVLRLRLSEHVLRVLHKSRQNSGGRLFLLGSCASETGVVPVLDTETVLFVLFCCRSSTTMELYPLLLSNFFHAQSSQPNEGCEEGFVVHFIP